MLKSNAFLYVSIKSDCSSSFDNNSLFWSCNSLAQDNNDYPWEQFHSDVKSRNFEKPIAFLKNNIANMESAPDNIFSDSTYIGMTTILSSIYIQSNLPYAADSLLNHAIDFFIQSKKN